jgi:uncharacterized SAM-binding protein YcdF (DUF218 family)
LCLRALVLIPAGIAFGLQLLASLFRMPQWLTDWLTNAGETLLEPPRYIVVLGGGGIPSETGLMRCYYAASCATEHPDAHVIVSLPAHTDPENSSVGRMRDELVLRGIPRDRVTLEHQALNTHQQAVAVAEMVGRDALDKPIVVVTSPFHVRRTVMCFCKAGFTQVSGEAAHDTQAEADFGGGVKVRYGFWDALETETHFTREVVALLYYRLRGWI